ncbi:MAG: 30S ribosomal protein S5 [Rhodothermaeota bacterium MED-G12]|jgi:small subunit ribosomal protein S5|nr:30S ribosomal protein S5 [Balneolaceae bacterium]MDA0736126.1 30S ribosomal protein S5 [Bacteroidota bacterium]PDH54560.1 MAG: 30S ribosomal protein S5 [Rhodothermaeota bacterium MED-G12]CAI8391426.1 MAG: 30S ribosomal protein S5 [Rhodothermaeota bacterium MED-G12]|tara:strand:+ start:764 stop:1288 length:525 start_codon:yes stop_codon:yes gene_type:complete
MPKVRRKQSVPAANLNLEEKLVHVNRVSKVVKGGRRFSFNAIVVVGDGNGVVGHGLGKANEVSDAIQKGFDNAKKNLIRVPLTKSGSIYHQVVGKAGAGKVLLRPASEGTGVIAGGAVKNLLDVAGVHNILSKSQGSSNPHNMVKAAFQALKDLTDPVEVAQRRGITMNKVFEG